MTIQFVDSSRRPVTDAVVSIAQAPGQIRDIAMITGDDGTVSVDAEESGLYTFSINHNGQLHQVSANLVPGDSATTLVVP